MKPQMASTPSTARPCKTPDRPAEKHPQPSDAVSALPQHRDQQDDLGGDRRNLRPRHRGSHFDPARDAAEQAARPFENRARCTDRPRRVPPGTRPRTRPQSATTTDRLVVPPSAFDHWLASAPMAGPIAASAITLRVGSVSTMRRIVARGSVQIVKKGVIEPPASFAIEAPVPSRVCTRYHPDRSRNRWKLGRSREHEVVTIARGRSQG